MYLKIINKKKKIITSIADLLGYAIWKPIKVFRHKKVNSPIDIREVLVIRTAYIGDVIMTLPILKPLKNLYPDAKVTFLTCTKAKEILENNPYVDEILTYDAFWFYPKAIGKALKEHLDFLKAFRNKHYDLIIEARADIRDILLLVYLSKSAYRVSYNVGGGGYLLTHVVPFKEIKHKVEYHLDIVRFLGCEVNGIEWELYLTPEEKNYAKTDLLKKGIKETDFVVGIHPGGRLDLKCWSFQRFAELADWIVERYDAKVVFTGTEEEKYLIKNIMTRMENSAINLSGKKDLRLLASLMERFKLFICNDSAPMHIASVMKTPTVAIFGPSKSRETGPYGNIHRVVENNFPCRVTCDENSCHHKRFHACMKDIAVEDVFEAVKAVLERLIYRAVNERGTEQAED